MVFILPWEKIFTVHTFVGIVTFHKVLPNPYVTEAVAAFEEGIQERAAVVVAAIPNTRKRRLGWLSFHYQFNDLHFTFRAVDFPLQHIPHPFYYRKVCSQ